MTTPRASQQVSSQQVSWYDVYLYVQGEIERAGVGELPPAGTPAWLALPDTDIRKLLSVAEAGVHWCLRVDTLQQAMSDASKAVAAAADWREIARKQTQLHAAVASGIRIPRKAS